MTTTLRYPGDAQSRREQEERHRIASERYRVEQVKRERIEAARPKPPTWWNELTPKMRRGVIYGMHADGMRFTEIAKELTLSPSRVHQLFRQVERKIQWAADARFPLRSEDWRNYQPRTMPVDRYFVSRFMERS